MNGFIAVTDQGWYERLARDPGPKDANFWRPSLRPVNLAVGTPFFFKLKAPHNAIAGFGYFAGYSVLPDWLAWDTFGESNGVESLEALRARLATIQARASIRADELGRIGCSLIAEAQFLAEENWVAPPREWRVRTQTGSALDLASGEGQRIWNECRERAGPLASVVREAAEAPRHGSPVLIRPRLGQGIFRVTVLDAYQRACSVTSEHSLPVLEAAHIRSFASGGHHDVCNGLVLRTDLHRLFDRGYATIDDQLRFAVSPRLRRDFGNGRSYDALNGRPLVLPAEPSLRPAPEALAWHREHRFRA